jgi:MFS transporter, putative metabolite:H+ symporter
MSSTIATQAVEAVTAASIAARIERIPFSTWHVRARLIVGIATFFNGFDMLAVAYVLPVLAPFWHLKPAQSGLLMSALFIGELVGAPVFGLVAERFGRRTALIRCTALFSAMSIASGFAWSYKSLLAFRFLVGVGLGAEVPIAVSYISEVSKAQGRGRFIILYEAIFAAGLVLAGLMGWWVVTRFGWRPLLVMGGAPAVVIFLMQRLLPESPRWLAQRGRLEEADRVVRQIENSTERSLQQPLPAPVRVDALPPRKASWRDILAPPYLRRSLVLWLLYFCCFFMNFGLTTWLPSLFTSVFHLSLSDALRNTLIIQVVGFLGTLVPAFLIDIVGRRSWFASMFLLSGVMTGAVWWQGADTAKLLFVGGVVAYFFLSTISITLILYAPELYPTRSRAIGVSIGHSMAVVAGVIAPVAVGAIVQTAGLATAFAVFAILAAAASFVALLFAVETRGRILEEISP